jgi:hypothetical protein
MVPDTAPTPKPAMVIKSKDPGAAGNNIRIAFSNVTVDPDNPGNSTLAMAITETDTYTGLKPSTIAGVIGTETTPGSKPGLVHLKASPAPALPKAGDYQLAGGGANPSSVDIDKNTGSGAAFTLEAKRAGADGDKTKVTIKDVDAVAGTFTLIATWSKTTPSPIKVSDIPASSAYELDVTAPTGGVLAAPVAGNVTLSGGADTDTVAALPASTIVLAS